MVKFFAIVLSLISLSISAQERFSKTDHDFGTLLAESQRHFDIEISNNGGKSFKIFSVRKPKEVNTLLSSKTVQSDGQVTLRLQVNPKKLGPFSYEVQVFCSDQAEPTVINLKGNVKEYDANNNHLFTACPSFSSHPANYENLSLQAFDLNVKVVDTLSKKAVKGAQIRLIQKGTEQWNLPTNALGQLKKKSDLGLSYFQVSHPDYQTKEFGSYINFKRNNIEVHLVPDTTSEEEFDNTVLDGVFKVPEVVKSKNDTAPQDETAKPTLGDLDPNNFDNQYFNSVNVVFILDVSTSMKHADKLELMKFALLQLSEMLRPEDRFGIVSYASNSTVLLEPTSGAEKDKIASIVQDLEAKGFTSGSKGLQLGYQTALDSKMPAGLNQVMIITDGSFNKDTKSLKRILKKYNRKGIVLSVVGIKPNKLAIDELENVAKLGGGSYVSIENLSDAQTKLKEEIKQRAYKGKD